MGGRKEGRKTEREGIWTSSRWRPRRTELVAGRPSKKDERKEGEGREGGRKEGEGRNVKEGK